MILEGDCMNTIHFGKAFAPVELQLVSFGLTLVVTMAGSLLLGWLVSRPKFVLLLVRQLGGIYRMSNGLTSQVAY
jgi:hypothetical protein